MVDKAGTEVRAWLDRLDERRRGEVEELARIVAAADPRLEQAVKWGRLTFTIDGNWHHWLCGITASGEGARLVFHKGAILEDPDRRLAGSGRYVRQVPAEDVLRRPDAINSLVGSAIAHQTDMLN